MSTNIFKPQTLRHLALVMASLAIGLTIYALLSQLSGWLTMHHFEFNLFSQLRFIAIKIWLPWLILSPLLAYAAKRVPLTPNRWVAPAFIHLAMFLTLMLIHGFALSYSYHYFEEMNPSMQGYLPWQHIGHFLFGDSLVLFDLIIYLVFIASFNLKNFYLIAQQQQLDAAKLQQQLAESKLQTLRMQINPHFLFNSLNVLSVLILKQANQQAGKMLDLLCGFLRNTLVEDKAMMIPLSQELERIRQYLAIEQVRFGERLTVSIDIQGGTSTIPVPTLILQPLVENAMNHGLADIEHNAKLSIQCRLQDDKLQIEISDNGVGCDFAQLKQNKGFGIGLSNTQQRLEQIYGTNFQLELDGNTGVGTTVTLTLRCDEHSIKELH